jgi:hypothetical protein
VLPFLLAFACARKQRLGYLADKSDHCTVKYLQQAGLKPTWIRLAEVGIHGNSHVMMQEKNNKEIAAVI